MEELFVQGPCKGFELRPDVVVCVEILLKRGLRADRLRWTGRLDDLLRVTAHRDVLQVLPERTELLDEVLAVVRLQIFDELESEFFQPVRSLRADAENLPNGYRREKCRHVVPCHHRQPIGLREIRGNLRDRFRGCDSDCAGESVIPPARGFCFSGEVLGKRENYPNPDSYPATTLLNSPTVHKHGGG